MKIILLLFIIPFFSLNAQELNEPNTTVYIYHDQNNNGAKESEEPYLSGFSLDVTGFDGQPINFIEESTGIFKGYVARRARVVVNGYSDALMEGNVGGKSSASVFYAEPKGQEVNYYVAVSGGPNIDYHKQNIILPCYEGGPAEGHKSPALIEYGFMHEGIIEKLGGDAPNPKVLATIEEIGSTWGIGIRHKANILYASALLKRHVGLGPKGIAGLYQYDLNTGTLSSFDLQGIKTVNGHTLDFGSISRKTTDGDIKHDGSDNNTLTSKDQVATYDIDAFAKVGKAGIGDIDVTEDEKTLWMVDLYSRSLIAVDVSTDQPNLNNIKSYPILEQKGLPDLQFHFVKSINVGGQEPGGAEAFTDPQKIAWERDKYDLGGQSGHSVKTITNTMSIAKGTTEPSLYKSYRVGNEFSYNIPVPSNGTYTVRLHFAETDNTFLPTNNMVQKERLFKVQAEGNDVLNNYNILKTAGGIATANVEEFSVEVNDGLLNLEFLGQMSNNVMTPAMVSGIQIIGSKDNKALTGEIRPWGLTFHKGKGYLGLVSDASITQSKDDLFGYIVSFDPENVDLGFQMELEFPLKYPRERSSYADSDQARPLRTSVWEAWVDTWEETGIEFDHDTMNLSYPQPIISDIDFDSEGNMIIGLMGRWAHQIGFLNYPPISGNQTYLIGYASGDILKAEPSPVRADGNYILEPNNHDTIPYFRNNDGPSYNGEFFYDDYFESPKAHHGEIFTGGMGVMQGINEVVLTVFNPIVTPSSNTNFDYNGVYTQGTQVYSTMDGSKHRASLIVGQYEFGKANGLGDMEFSLSLPNNCVGNYVWCDGNGDGIQQANEVGIPGVKLYLIQIDEVNGNQLIDSTTTDENGIYYFCDIERGLKYIIKIDLSQSALDGFQRKASPALQGTNPRLNSDGLDNLIPGCVIAEVNNLDLQYNYTFDFGLLGPESRDATRTLCLEQESSTAVFDLCEIDSAVRMPGVNNTLVEYYKTEDDARLGVNPVTRQGQCGYESTGEMLVAKVYIAGDELCYSLSKVTLVVTDIETNIDLEDMVCLGETIDLEQRIDLNQGGLMVFTQQSMENDDMIADINNYVADVLPVTLYFKATFGDNCNAFGSLTLTEVPPFEIEMKDQASICWGDIFYFSNLDISFPTGGSAIDDIKWTTNGTGTFNSGMEFSKAQSYTPSVQDSARGYVEFYLNASNTCYSEERTVYLEIITKGDIRIECPPVDTVYCYDTRISDPYHPNFPKPKAYAGCDYNINPILNFVDIDMDHCDSTSDVSSRIIRHWEFDYKGEYSIFCYDTIVVLNLPLLTPDAFIGKAEDSFYCELEGVTNKGEVLKRYASWKQPLGLHDYELPNTKLRGVTYELPLTIVEAGLQNALSQGTNVYAEYLKFVILRKANGTEITIGDIVSGKYMQNLIASASNSQKLYGFLQALIEFNKEPVKIILETQVLNYYPYLLLQPGDWILSENGKFEKVEEDWFYNGNGNTPYWFAGGWPSIYGNGECIFYCDIGNAPPITKDGCIKIKVPALNNGLPFDPENCDTICLSIDGGLCGITVERNQSETWNWTGSCPQTRGVDTWITQTCWGNTHNGCASDLTADEVDLVVSYDSTAKGGVKIHLSQWQTLIDTLGPIFDFCYPVSWDHKKIKASIRNGVIGSDALAWERDNPTIFSVNSHTCEAEVYVPSVKVIDNCSGVHSVKAMVDVKGGTRAVTMERTATEIKIMAGGDTCYIYTFSHTTDPIIIPMSGFNGELNEVRYEAADNCWNQSTWSKFIRIEDNTPPTVVANRELTFSLQGKKGWMNAIDIDEGSWDNCGDILVLGRRVDWDDFCVGLCTDKLVNVTTLEELNKIDPLSVLDSGEVELYYRSMIEWLKEDEACGEKVVEGWLQGIRSHWAKSCGPKDEHGNPLIDVPQNYIGGGWSKKIPFGCEDACKTVMVEILVMDQWCNWSKTWATIYVEDAVPAKKLVTLDDITLTCDAYAKYYKPVLDLATQAGNSDEDQALFNHLDNLLGGYQAVWSNNTGQPVDMEGNVLPTDFSVINTVCEDSVKEIRYQETGHDNQIVWKTRRVSVAYLDDKSVDYTKGYVGVNCSATIRQDIWPDLSDCGVGTIMRKFYVTTGCGEKEVTTTYVQNITIEPTCPLRREMFSWPEDTEVCMALTLNSNGKANLPVSQVGKAEYTFPQGCRMIAIGYNDKILDVIGNVKMKKVLRQYTAMDWCTGESVEHEQVIIVNDTCGNPDGGNMTLAGTIVDPNDNFIQNVTLNMEMDPTSKKSYDIEDGKYFMNVTENPELLYLDKEGSYRNGVSTLDLIWLQRYLRDPSVFNNPYQKIAADVNNNGMVEASDIFQIRDLVLGRSNSFIHVKPWQFVDKSTNKYYSTVKTSSLYQENNWVGVKMGDVNFDSDYLIRSTNRSREEVYPISVEEVTSGDGSVSLVIKMTEAIRLSGFQMSFDLSAFETWRPEISALGMTNKNWSIEGNDFKVSWNSIQTDRSFDKGEVLFSIALDKTIESVHADNVQLNSGFNSEVYTSDLEIKQVGLRYVEQSDGLRHTIYPNPADQYQVFDIYAPMSTLAVITIKTIDGKDIESFKLNLQQGQTTYDHILSDRYKSGVYVYQIKTKEQLVTGRFEVIR